MKDEELLVGSVMKTDVVSVKESTTLRELMGIFARHAFHTFPVVRGKDTLMGVVSFEDILKIFVPTPLASPHLRDILRRSVLFEDDLTDFNLVDADIPPEMGLLCLVKDLMNTNIVTVSPATATREARSIMRLHEMNTLFVEDGGHLVGVVSLFDIVLAVLREKGIVP